MGRVTFDRAAAEESIRRAYRASGLARPEQILWARGPAEAAEALRFLRRPPRRQLHLGLALIICGAALWPALALAIDAANRPNDPVNAATLIAGLAAYALARIGGQSLPLPPAWGPRSSRRRAVLAGAAAFVAMVGALLAVQNLGLPAEQPALGGVLALTAAAGTLPGVLLLLRLRRAFRRLPAALRSLSPARSVARALLSARHRARTSSANDLAGPGIDESLLRAYRTAYAEAFLRPGDLWLETAGTAPSRQPRFGDESILMMPGFVRHIDPALFPIPAHLDGIEDAELAFAAEREGNDEGGAFEDLAFHVDRLFPFRNIALAVRPPTTMALDADGRPHAEGGPAIAWADGTRIYAWRGRITDDDVVDTRKPLTLSRIVNEGDRDRRRVLIERYGLGRFLTESRATKIDSDECGTLYRLEQPGEPIVAVRVVNSTAEPDGSFRDFWLRVPPGMQTARQAVAWTFGLSPEEYGPTAQS